MTHGQLSQADTAVSAAAMQLRANAAIVAALLPAAADLSWSGTLAWAAALVVGAAIGERSAVRWIALAWAAAAVVPGVNAMAIIAAGLLAGRWPHVLPVVAAGAVLGIVVPVQFRTAGILLLVAAAAVVVTRRRSDAI